MPTCFSRIEKEHRIKPQQLTREQRQNQNLVPTGTPPGGTYVQIKHEIKNVNINDQKHRYAVCHTLVKQKTNQS